MDTLFGGAPTMDKGTFGEHLRREREMRGVSLDEVSQATRIGTRFLEALESERWKDLPGGVFNRGFLRSIARYLGLDEEALVAEYAQATNDHPQMAEWSPSALDRGAEPRPKNNRHLAFLISLLILTGLGATGWWGWTRYGSAVQAWRSPLPAVPVPKPPAAPAVAPSSEPAGSDLSVSNAPGASPVAEDLELRVEVSRTTEVSVSGDGKTLFHGTMTRGENHTFTAKDRFEVSAQNSFALVLELNGVSMAPVGAPNTPGKVTLTHKDLVPAHGTPGEPH